MRTRAWLLSIVLALIASSARAQSRPPLPTPPDQPKPKPKPAKPKQETLPAEPVAAADHDPTPAQRGDAGAAWALGLSFDAPWYGDRGYDVFADDDTAARFGLWLSHDVVAWSDDLIGTVELGWGSEHDDNRVLDLVDTSLSTHVAYAGLTTRWIPVAWLQPHVRVAAGVAFVGVELRRDELRLRERSGGPFDDLSSPYASLGLGFTLRTATRSFEEPDGTLASLSVGVMFEGGYSLAGPLDVTLDGPDPTPADLAITEAGLGELERSGPYLRVSLVGRL